MSESSTVFFQLDRNVVPLKETVKLPSVSLTKRSTTRTSVSPDKAVKQRQWLTVASGHDPRTAQVQVAVHAPLIMNTERREIEFRGLARRRRCQIG